MAACATKKRKAQPMPTFLQSANTAAMCTACHCYACSPPPIPAFWLAQDLPSKQTAPKHVAKVA